MIVKKLSAMEQIKNTRKKLGPLDTLKRAKLEEKMTSNLKSKSKVHRQQKEQQHSYEDMDKNDEEAMAGGRNKSKEGGSTNMG